MYAPMEETERDREEKLVKWGGGGSGWLEKARTVLVVLATVVLLLL